MVRAHLNGWVAAVLLAVLAVNLSHAQLTEAEKTQLLNQHNAFRCMHEEPGMTWNATLATQAQAWADKIKNDYSTSCWGPHSDALSSYRNGAVIPADHCIASVGGIATCCAIYSCINDICTRTAKVLATEREAQRGCAFIHAWAAG